MKKLFLLPAMSIMNTTEAHNKIHIKYTIVTTFTFNILILMCIIYVLYICYYMS